MRSISSLVESGQASLVALSSADPAVVSSPGTLASGLLGCRMIFPSPDTLSRLLPEISHCFETKDAPLFGDDLSALIDETWSVPPKGAPTAQIEDFPGCASPQDEWLIFGTSGTTGRKKFVPLTFQALHRRSEVEAALLPASQTRMVCLFGTTSAAFMQRVFLCLLYGWNNRPQRRSRILAESPCDARLCIACTNSHCIDLGRE